MLGGPDTAGIPGVIKLPVLEVSNDTSVGNFRGISVVIVHCLGW